MKKFFTLFAAALCSTAMMAQFADGVYFIKNVDSGKYLGGANAWGTQASLMKHATPFTLAKVSEGVYTISGEQSNGGNNHYFNGTYVDGAATNIYFTAYGDNYVMSTAEEANYVAVNGNILVNDGAEVGGAAQWQIISKEDAIANLANASKANPIDATFLIGDANFSRNYNSSYWASTASNLTLAGGNNDNMCAESWCSTFTLLQSVTVPNGIYQLTAQAALTDYANKYDGADYPVVYANEASTPFLNMEGTDIGSNMWTMSTAFSNGKYTVEPIQVLVSDGTLTVGVMGSRTDTWCIWDNFELSYLGEDLSALREKTMADYNEIKDASMNALVRENMNATYDAFNAEESKENLTAFAACVSEAKASAAAYSVVILAINEYSQKAFDELGIDGYAEFYSKVIDLAKAYGEETAEGSLTDVAVVKEAYLAGVKAQTEPGSDFTEILPTTWVGQTGSLGANSWANANPIDFAERYNAAGSIEGDVMTQTLTDLPNGTYVVTLDLAASYTSGRGFECPTGDGLSVAFANDVTENLPVVERTGLAADGYNHYELECAVTDGTLTYGIKNPVAGGNWYAASVSSVVYKSTDVPTAIRNVNATETVKAGKYLENGRLVISKNGKKFNASGVEVK